MIETKLYKNEKYKFYNSLVQAISRGEGCCATKIVASCAHFFDMGALVKNQVEMGLISSSISWARPLMYLTKLFLT